MSSVAQEVQDIFREAQHSTRRSGNSNRQNLQAAPPVGITRGQNKFQVETRPRFVSRRKK